MQHVRQWFDVHWHIFCIWRCQNLCIVLTIARCLPNHHPTTTKTKQIIRERKPIFVIQTYNKSQWCETLCPDTHGQFISHIARRCSIEHHTIQHNTEYNWPLFVYLFIYNFVGWPWSRWFVDRNVDDGMVEAVLLIDCIRFPSSSARPSVCLRPPEQYGVGSPFIQFFFLVQIWSAWQWKDMCVWRTFGRSTFIDVTMRGHRLPSLAPDLCSYPNNQGA